MRARGCSMAESTGSATVNGSLWGARARAWAEIQEATARPLYVDVIERLAIGGGSMYLDVGCGSGMALQLAASRGATVAGLDAADALVAIARERVPSADVRVGELETLPFPGGAFDVVTGFNSFQFAAHPAHALAEAKRVAKKGATIVIATWTTPDRTQAAALLGALKPLLPVPPPGAPGPFALSDEAALRALATAAGLDAGRGARRRVPVRLSRSRDRAPRRQFLGRRRAGDAPLRRRSGDRRASRRARALHPPRRQRAHR